MKKHFIRTVLGICIIFSVIQIPALVIAGLNAPTFSSSNNLLRCSNASSISLNMSYNLGTLSWNGLVKGNSDVTKISVTYTLYRQGSSGTYTEVDSWKDSTTSSTKLLSSGSTTVTSGTYKLVVSGTVVAPGYTESISMDLIKALS